MIRAAVVCALLAAGLSAGCRGDLFRPEPVEETGASLDEAWTPDVVVIGPDGTSLENFTVSFDNTWYYGDGGPLASRRRVTSQTVENGVVLFPAVPIVPPFFVSTGGSPFPVLLHDVVPPADGPLVIDLSEPTHWLRYALPEGYEDWPRAFLDLDVEYRPALASVPPRESSFFEDLGAILEPGVVPLVLSSALQTRFFAAQLTIRRFGGDGLDLRWRASFPEDVAPGDTLEVRPPLRRFWVEVLEGGETAPSVPVALDTRRVGQFSDNDRTPFVRTEHVLDGAAVRTYTVESPFDLRVEAIGSGHFLPRRHRFEVADGDTVVVDLGRFEVEVRVEDDEGRPLRGRRVRLSSQTDRRTGDVQQATGSNGRSTFRLDPDFYRVEVLGSGSSAADDSIVYVDQDTTFVFVEGAGTGATR